MSTAHELAQALADKWSKSGHRLADLFGDSAVTVIPPEADKRARGTAPAIRSPDNPYFVVHDSPYGRTLYKIKRDFEDVRAIAYTRSDAQAIADLFNARQASPGDGPDTAPHVRGSDTSKAAARAVSPKLAGKRQRLLEIMLFEAEQVSGRGSGFTDNELVRRMSGTYAWSANTPRARRVELEQSGWLEDSGERRNGSTVWRPTDKAWTWWREQQNGGGS
jgi:hypothetical protein